MGNSRNNPICGCLTSIAGKETTMPIANNATKPPELRLALDQEDDQRRDESGDELKRVRQHGQRFLIRSRLGENGRREWNVPLRWRSHSVSLQGVGELFVQIDRALHRFFPVSEVQALVLRVGVGVRILDADE